MSGVAVIETALLNSQFELVFYKQSRLQYFREYHTQNLERKKKERKTKYLIQYKLGYYLPFV